MMHHVLIEHIARHRGNKAPRTKEIRGVTFHSIYRGMHGSYWVAEHNGRFAFVREHWVTRGTGERGGETRETHHVTAIVDGSDIGKRFREESRALEAAAKALVKAPRP